MWGGASEVGHLSVQEPPGEWYLPVWPEDCNSWLQHFSLLTSHFSPSPASHRPLATSGSSQSNITQNYSGCQVQSAHGSEELGSLFVWLIWRRLVRSCKKWWCHHWDQISGPQQWATQTSGMGLPGWSWSLRLTSEVCRAPRPHHAGNRIYNYSPLKVRERNNLTSPHLTSVRP